MERRYVTSGEVRELLGLSSGQLARWVDAGLPTRALRAQRERQFAVAMVRELVRPEWRGLVDAIAQRRVALVLPLGSPAAVWVAERTWPSRGATLLDELKRDCAAWQTAHALDAAPHHMVTWALARSGYQLIPSTLKAKPGAYRVFVGVRLRSAEEPPAHERRELLAFEDEAAGDDTEIRKMLLARRVVAVPAVGLRAARSRGVRPFVENCCLVGKGLAGLTPQLHDAYVRYCAEVEIPPVSQRRFAELLAREGYCSAARSVGEIPADVRSASSAEKHADVRLGLVLKPYAAR